MNPRKEEMLTALQHKRASRQVPLWELEFHLWNKFTDRNFIIGTEFAGLTGLEKQNAIKTDVEIMAEVSEELGFSAVNIPAGYWEVAPGQPAYYWFPDEWRDEFAKEFLKVAGDDMLLIVNTGGLLGMPDADKFLEFSYMLFDNPEEIDRMAEETFRKGIENVRKYSDMGYQCIITTSDIADNHGPYFSPDQIERYLLPYASRLAETAHSCGMKHIFHTDGNIDGLIPDLISCGIDAIQSIDPIANMDIVKCQKLYSDQLTLCGNVDCGDLLTASPEVIYEKTKEILVNCRMKGSFVLGASNAVQAEVPKENYLAMNKAWRDYGNINS